MPKIPPISRLGDFFQTKKEEEGLPRKKGETSKVEGVVRSTLDQSPPGNLFATNHVGVIPLLQEKKGVKQPSSRRGAKRAGDKLIPVGLPLCEEATALNALLQLIAYLPGFQTLFTFASRAFHPFVDFLSFYSLHQKEGHTLFPYDAEALLRPIQWKIEPQTFLFLLAKAAFPHQIRGVDSIALHPDWNLAWDVSQPFSYALDAHLINKKMRPPEFFVSPKNHEETSICQLVERQYFSHSNADCYDLDAFIESRPDDSEKGHFIAYVKIEGAWYQCDDERVTQLRSSSLNVPLHGSVLLHYKKINWR